MSSTEETPPTAATQFMLPPPNLPPPKLLIVDDNLASNWKHWKKVCEGQKEDSINDVLTKFDEYCEPRTQVIYERYRFNNRKKEAGESISAYMTELRVIAKNCAHDEITPDEILRDRLVLGVWDDEVRERLLRLNDLTLFNAIDICKAGEQTNQLLKMITSRTEDMVGAVKTDNKNGQELNSRKQPECRYCGYHHANRQCPAYGQICRKCGQKNHFKAKC
ncbi:uncharacterized protein LOC141897771 [Acropora palmata]|uniref:uncharacterized protein LOC141897771 n=1 Tax=Acropora palmata TaxID=6131 RepID=UPI003DA0EED3